MARETVSGKRGENYEYSKLKQDFFLCPIQLFTRRLASEISLRFSHLLWRDRENGSGRLSD
jgi:hypothetical protein